VAKFITAVDKVDFFMVSHQSISLFIAPAHPRCLIARILLASYSFPHLPFFQLYYLFQLLFNVEKDKETRMDHGRVEA
jgi:hypothetical protein